MSSRPAREKASAGAMLCPADTHMRSLISSGASGEGGPKPPARAPRGRAGRRRASRYVRHLAPSSFSASPLSLHPASNFASGLGIPGTSAIVSCPTTHVLAPGRDHVPTCRCPVISCEPGGSHTKHTKPPAGSHTCRIPPLCLAPLPEKAGRPRCPPAGRIRITEGLSQHRGPLTKQMAPPQHPAHPRLLSCVSVSGARSAEAGWEQARCS